ncbi:tyrosine-type recombinase/integrase [Tepidanaerobacter syntrophicus]|uniref:Site-specific recombinase XerD n=1 Tax=Tepidanaerobacter syntrophicus TaxID=224999 RepID=A0A0U9HQ61_9FIRM|nr:tyrosine-type recombinase/integrase [Tepidanaerobacter syntrophicus]GAQ26033.1 site-specific recombinase XerD [Tepidanaerobacter syntrophicus]HHV82601.1 tyrosine-type recombinase/integrase [Tepidanaerobacter syntrophicus]
MLFKFAIKDFLDDRKLKNLSPATIKSYEVTLEHFHRYLTQNEKINVEDVTQADIKSYLISCREEGGNRPTSLNHKIGNLKVFFNYMADIETIEKNPMKKVQKVKTDVKIEAFTDYHIKQMLNYYRRIKQRNMTLYAYRDYTIIVTLLGTGIRRGELCNLTWHDVDLANSKMTIYGKARRQRTIPLTDKLKQELIEWRLFNEKHFYSFTPERNVFTDGTGKRLTENAVGNIFKRLAKIMNFRDVRVSAHTFRHTFAKNWILSGGDVFSLQRILGHSTLDMTNKYVSLFGSAIKEQNEKHNPLNNLDI